MNQPAMPPTARLGPAPASVVVATGLILLTVIPLVTHTAAVLPLLFPLAATVAAVVLFRSSLPAYLALIWWLWILTPEIRRLVEFQTGWNPNDPLTLAPYLATAVALVTILRRVRWLRSRLLSPFVFVMAGLLLGFLIGHREERDPSRHLRPLELGPSPGPRHPRRSHLATSRELPQGDPPALGGHVGRHWRYMGSSSTSCFRLGTASG